MNNQNNNNQQPGGEVSVSFSETQALHCSNPECRNTTFVQGARMGRLSAVHPKNPTRNAIVVPFPTWICAACGAEAESEGAEKV